MADERFTNQGLIIQRMKLQDVSAKNKSDYLAKRALKETRKTRAANKIEVVEM